MALTMSGEATLPATKYVVWAKLNDPDVLKLCIPGSEQLTKHDDTHFSVLVKVKLGPVRATFKGKVELVDLDQPTGCRIQGEGEGGIAGFAKGGARVALIEVESGQTLLRYEVEAQVGGKLMQLGARLIDAVSRKLADEFFANFSKEVAEG